jgi:hypothetical protein
MEFASTVEAVEEVCREFGLRGEFEDLGENRWICSLALSWTDVVRQVAFVLDTDGPLLAVYVVVELPRPWRKKNELLAAVTRANYGLLPGTFEYEAETGQVRYRSVLWPLPDEVHTSEVAQLLSGALLIANAYAPALRAVIESSADPIATIDAVEAT